VLGVEYLYEGARHFVVVRNREGLALPLRGMYIVHLFFYWLIMN
jgi:hypothetical protein